MKQWKYITGSEADFEGAPEWATCACQGVRCIVYYEHITGRGRWINKGSSSNGHDGVGGFPVIAQRELITIWNGEGLPPVGTVCEWLASGDHDWINVTVLGHDGEDTWLKPDDGTQSFVVSCAEDFRPVQNERQKAIEQMFYALPEDKRPGIDIREAIYDAGYRKHSCAPGFEWRIVCLCCGCRVEPGQEIYHGCDL